MIILKSLMYITMTSFMSYFSVAFLINSVRLNHDRVSNGIYALISVLLLSIYLAGFKDLVFSSNALLNPAVIISSIYIVIWFDYVIKKTRRNN